MSGVFGVTLGRSQVESRRMGGSRLGNPRAGAALVLLAIGFLLLVPDPHDHGDAASLGGLFRLLLPSSSPVANAQETGGKPRPGPQGLCPVHFWQQVAGTILLFALLLPLFLTSDLRILPTISLPRSTDLGSFHSRAPPILL